MIINTYKTKLDDNKLNILVKENTIKYTDGGRLTSPEAIVDMMNEVFDLKNMAEEYVYMIATDTKNNVLGVFEVSHGTANASFLGPRELFIRALLCGAISIFLVHNHPSGDPEPSLQDIQAIRRIAEAGKLLGIALNDHIIIGNGFYSMKQHEDF